MSYTNHLWISEATVIIEVCVDPYTSIAEVDAVAASKDFAHSSDWEASISLLLLPDSTKSSSSSNWGATVSFLLLLELDMPSPLSY